MAGMVIFFAFFTGASTAETIISEDEGGTLGRLFTTPTSRAVILGGKFAAVFITLVVQVIVLMLASAIIFRIRWGEPLAVALVALGLVVAAAGLGVLLMSLLKSTRQAGPVMGTVLTLSGMVGGLFTTGFQNLPPFYETINLLTPHGWALRGWKLALAGGGVSDVLLPAVATLGMGIVFFFVGAFFFRRRFA
jgi:ABC-2 type transport system permease protein